jgi:hypothetical protein
MGYDVTKTFTIHESESVDGVFQFELLVDGVTDSTYEGDNREDGWLEVIARITGQEPEIPNN